MGWDLALGLIRYGNRFKAYRKLARQQMGSHTVHQYQQVQEAAVHALLLRLTKSSENYRQDISRFGICSHLTSHILT